VPRVLSMRHTIVPSADRAEFHERARRLSAHYGARGCHYWLFEESSLPGAYVEFFEAGDPATLQHAHAGALGTIDPAARTYIEINLA
jgi:hypothetical protein